MFLSVFDIFKIGIGPSSSHTMGPMVAASRFLGNLRGGVERTPGAGDLFGLGASLHGSLAFTGRGHATDRAVILGLCGLLPETLDPDRAEDIEAQVRKTGLVEPAGLPSLRFDPDQDLIFDYGPPLPGHPNGLVLKAYDRAGNIWHRETYYSIGGGFVMTEAELGAAADTGPAGARQVVPYPFRNAEEMLRRGRASGMSIARMKRANEEAVYGTDLDARLDRVWEVMDGCIRRGLSREGILPGRLKVRRRAKVIYDQLLAERGMNMNQPHQVNDWMSVYAMAVNEENAAGGGGVPPPPHRGAGGGAAGARRYLAHQRGGRRGARGDALLS